MSKLGVLTLLCAILASPESFGEARVPLFLSSREPAEGATGHPPEKWSHTDNVSWKTDLPGLGWSSPIVSDDRVFVTTCISAGETAEPRKGLYIEDVDANKYPPVKDIHVWKVFCLDLASGEIIWEKAAHEGIPSKPHHIKNTLASETPATDGERIYAHFGNVGLFCYNVDGALQWTYEVEPRETRYGWGTSQSPVVHAGRVYLCNDNEEASFFVALDARTGKEVWRVDREEKTNYATPFVWENELRTEIVLSGINWTHSYDLTGKPLWRLKGKSILAIPTPFEKFGQLYLTSGHVVWGESPMYCIRAGATGDISPVEGEPLNESLVWRRGEGGPYHPTPLIVNDILYVLLDRGFMTAYDAHTGEPVYATRKKRIPKGRAFTSSPWTYGEKLFCLNEDGVTFVIQSGPEFKVLHTNHLADDDMCMATPVIVDDKLLIRSSKRIYCLKRQ